MKIAVVTGASSGMGREMAIQISKAYPWLDEIWVIARSLQELQRLQRKCQVKLRVLPLDLAKDIDLTNLRVLLKDQDPRIKLLVNSAGFGKIGEFGDSDYSENLGMVDVNCRALTAVTYLCLPYMRGGSRILQFSSSAAFLPQPGFAVYAATKSYVLSFTRALRREVNSRGISVTCVCPGPVDTRFFERAEKTASMAEYKKKYMVDKQAVVRQALYDAVLEKEVSVYGMPMKGVRVLSKILPHSLILECMKGIEHK